ncbi:SDR family oxidoreductase [Oscillibacter sp.]|uniref:SDR family NAD(P)-dependent oxidoreductase n=1 Tax=Oscillibacter sp. TaxID=1945593 RepID=UPI0026108D0F|nr:SDR family oxidoreductase [Oscillibacter sp.]MDD3347892.1 SDR family oxidoreductase [Oscillibacter sp.]
MENFTMEQLFDLKGKKAVVTGGTRGLGRAMAECLLQNGCDVMLVSRRGDDLGELQTLAAQKGVQCLFHACDITDTAAVVEMARAAEAAMGGVDILINAAGMNEPKLLEEMDDDTWDRILNLNLRASFVVTREVVRVMRKRHYGKIINISSMKSILGVSDAGYTAYCASKGAINMLTKQIACEVAADGITVNAIAPTFIKTAINARQLEDPVFYKALTDRIPVGRIGAFRDLAGLTVLLASDASEFITGQTILLDGGIAARQ